MLARIMTNVLLVVAIVAVSAETLCAVSLVPTEIYAEMFDTNTADLASTELAYPDLSGLGTVNVSSQQVQIIRGGNNNLLTDQTFNEEIWVSADLGMSSSSPSFGGGFAPGLVIGNRIFHFFPGFLGGGSFRIRDYNPLTGVIGSSLVGSINMGFIPGGDVLHEISVYWDGATGFDVKIIDGNNPLNIFEPATFTLPGFTFGGVGFSAIHGTGTAQFDNLSVIALREEVVPEPSSLLLLGLGALGLVRHTRRRRRRA